MIAALPDEFAATVATAAVEQGELTIGAVSGAWATRLRYMTDTLRQRVGAGLGFEISSGRIRVVQPEPTITR